MRACGDDMKTLFILAGIPGSGKSSIARMLAPNANFSADDFFEKGGQYNWTPDKLYIAHKTCQNNVEKAMKNNENFIAVHNTNLNNRERKPYIELAEKYDYSVNVIVCEGNFKDIHNINEEAKYNMAKKFQHHNKYLSEVNS